MSDTPNILVHHGDPEPLVELIQGRFPDTEITSCSTYADLPEAVADSRAEAVLSFRFEPGPYPREALLVPPVRWVHVGGVAVDHLAPWNPEVVTVTNSAGIHADVIAEYALAAVFALNLKLHRFVRNQAAHRWAPEPLAQSAGGTMLVVGLGRLGRAVAARAKAHGMQVIGASPRATQAVEGIDGVFGLDDLRLALPMADYVVLFLPLTDRTRGLIDGLALAAMRRGSYLINMAHGGIVDEPALIAALRSGHLGGAVLDAFAVEPLPADSPLWDLDNVIVTPRATTLFDGWERACAELFCDNLERAIAGEPLANVVEPEGR
ncbi:MAG TPA: D-2-hydroxyacid dehydrogenase [Geminicoccaceae bacterium]|nr:D-2-hydroxyacid dehydrogenase [Geminicoccaceae bacterium]